MNATELNSGNFLILHRLPILQSGKKTGVDLDGDGQITKKDVVIRDTNQQDLVKFADTRTKDLLQNGDLRNLTFWKGGAFGERWYGGDLVRHMEPLSNRASWAIVVGQPDCEKPRTLEFVIYEPKD